MSAPNNTASPTPPEQAAQPADVARLAEFDQWWESEGQYCRAGGGDYERSFAYAAWRAALAAKGGA